MAKAVKHRHGNNYHRKDFVLFIPRDLAALVPIRATPVRTVGIVGTALRKAANAAFVSKRPQPN